MASRRVRLVIKSLEGFVEKLIRKIVLDVTANLIASPSEGGTPVDTGWARANWVPNIGSALSSPAGSRASAEAGSLPGAQAAGLATVATGYKLRQGAVHITNNVPYILRLNEGSSSQAPRGFAQNAIAKAVRVDLPRSFGV